MVKCQYQSSKWSSTIGCLLLLDKNRGVSIEKSGLVIMGNGMVDGFLATKIFILLKKIVVDVGKNDIPQFPLMFPGEG